MPQDQAKKQQKSSKVKPSPDQVFAFRSHFRSSKIKQKSSKVKQSPNKVFASGHASDQGKIKENRNKVPTFAQESLQTRIRSSKTIVETTTTRATVDQREQANNKIR